jgi:hypothetical protein
MNIYKELITHEANPSPIFLRVPFLLPELY